MIDSLLDEAVDYFYGLVIDFGYDEQQAYEMASAKYGISVVVLADYISDGRIEK